jgi:hypothetical protein
MAAMVDTVLRRSRLSVVCCALLAAALVGACSRVVSGAAQPGDPAERPRRPIPVADLLIEPTRFPARYPAAVVPPKDVDRVMAEIDGVTAGSDVKPPECAPLPVLADQRAAAQGTDDESGARLTVTVIRPVPSVRARVAQLTECPSFTSVADGEAGEVSEVTVELRPPPPVDADDSYAVDQTVTPQSAGEQDSRTLTLVALVADVQVTASWQQGGSSDDSPDTQALDTLFTDAVLKVRREIPR